MSTLVVILARPHHHRRARCSRRRRSSFVRGTDQFFHLKRILSRAALDHHYAKLKQLHFDDYAVMRAPVASLVTTLEKIGMPLGEVLAFTAALKEHESDPCTCDASRTYACVPVCLRASNTSMSTA